MFPSRETLLESVFANGSWQISQPETVPEPLAVIGLRSCDLHALAIQDKVFLGGTYVDPGYQQRRQNLFVVAVNCRRAAATCFCHSMQTGPAVKSGFDLALTEVNQHFVVEIGTSEGADLVGELEWNPCATQQVRDAQLISAEVEQRMEMRCQSDKSKQHQPRERFLDTTDIHDLLLANLDHPRWAQVAE